MSKKPSKTLCEWCIENHREDLLEEWDYKENNKLDITPKTIAFSSNKEVHWTCPKGHRYKRKISERTNRNYGCAFCSGNKVLIGYNDLKTYCKNEGLDYIIDEWDDEKDITEFSRGSTYKAKWKCRFCGHKWPTQIGNRINLAAGRTNCPKCNNRTSFSEQAVFYYSKLHFPDTVNRHTDFGFELDIYIPSIKTAIEYDGLNYHKKNPQAEILKNKQCKHNNITLIRIREEGLCKYSECKCFFRKKSKNTKDFDYILENIFKYLGVTNCDINVNRDYSKILENYKTLFLENSLAYKFPEIAKEWHPTKNGKLKPENFNYGSKHTIWWQCEKGHEWQATINNRKNGSGCPYCSGKKAIKGKTDLATMYPKLIKEWHPTKNGDLKPEDFLPYSHTKIWWKCEECGNEWKTRIESRTLLKYNCPKCSKKTASQKCMKKILCVETGELFSSLREASERKNISMSHISSCCTGHRHTSGGYHWEYVDKENIQEKEE